MTNRKLILDIWKQTPKITIPIRQGETSSRFLDISLIDGSQPFDLTNKAVMVYMTKPDNKIIYNHCQIINPASGQVRIALTSQMSIAHGVVRDFELHIIGAVQSRLKVTGIELDIQRSVNIDHAVESTDEFTALLEALKKAEVCIDSVTEFLTDKGVEVEAAIQRFHTDGAQAMDAINQRFVNQMGQFSQQVNTAVSSANTATQNANQAAQTAVSTAATTAINTVNDLKGKPNGVAALDANGKLAQMPTVDDLDIKNIFLSMYPVGSIYITTSATNPGTLFGGVWRAFAPGRVLVGVNPSDSDFSTSGKMGGSKTHTLTVNEMPKHVHTQTLHWSAQAGNSSVVSPALETNDPREYSTYPTTGETGGGQPHNNLQPYITCYMWRRSA